LLFCPWCGKKLPRTLRIEWLRRLGRVGVSLPPSDPAKDRTVPLAYRTDAWWKKRKRSRARGRRQD
jgi:hypothetical protein